ncbi:hypothetical protein B0T22DRAFT_494505 [Podospora appendiculata]|uniref:Uncharacterized protein n=1 Tax=Podospora appendiculata TaxID=314037 RepID=A0AAE0X1M3_9PEZI|nr:hypothetical protein B0T22DRAFT_494505 [Podospora appendiculata]
MRLLWDLEGPIATSIRVLDDPTNPFSPHQAYQTALDPTPEFHPISKSPITEPKVSSLNVYVYHLDDWAECWEIIHEVHYDDAGQEFEPHVPEGSEYLTPRLIRCCGTERPKPPSPVVVRAATHPFVTVHDYVTTVHPWLMGLKDDIRPAMSAMEGRQLTEDAILVVDPLVPDEIKLLYSPPSGSGVRQIRAEMAGRVQVCKTAATKRLELGKNPVAVQARAADPVDAETAQAMWVNQLGLHVNNLRA